MLRYAIFVVCFALLCTIATEKTAHAYIDPSTGSYILTVLIGGLAGAGFAIKLYWKKFNRFFFSKFFKKTEPD